MARSLLLLIDGYNVVSPIAAPGRGGDVSWLQRERSLLIRRLAEGLPSDVCSRTSVVFDAAHPPGDRPDRFTVAGIDVRFAVGYREADDLIEELIAAHSAPKRLAVVSSDHRIQVAAGKRSCAVFDSQTWLDELLEGNVRLAIKRRQRGGQGSDGEKPDQVSSDDADQWLKDFGM